MRLDAATLLNKNKNNNKNDSRDSVERHFPLELMGHVLQLTQLQPHGLPERERSREEENQDSEAS